MERQRTYLDYCFGTLLPIWERWTEGEPSLRRALECVDADPRTQAERRAALMHVIADLMVAGSTWAESAAMSAGFAVLAALGGETGAGFREFVRLAVDADSEAEQRAPHA